MNEPVQTRKLGQTGIAMSMLGLGTWGLCAESYGKIYPEQRARTLARALDQGLRVFDMAPWWGDDGASETEVRTLVDTRRAEMVYITRAGLTLNEAGPELAYDAKALTAQCESSLKRLHTDRIDIWLLHEPRESDLRSEEVRDCVEALRKAGKIRAWGVATSQMHVARAAMESDAQALCLPFHLHKPQLVWDLASDAAARGIGIIARSVLLHGLLSGRWNKNKRFAPDDHRSQRWHTEALGGRVLQTNDLRFLVHGNTLSLAAAAQRFVLSHEAVACALIGPRTPGQVEASMNALSDDAMLPAEDLERVRRQPR